MRSACATIWRPIWLDAPGLSGGSPALWRVVVGRETTIEGAGRLAERIRSGQGKMTQTLVIREAARAPAI